MFEHLVDLFTKIIASAGYFGITVLMTLESMVVPVPSEAVMPFAGFLWWQGKLSFWLIVAYSTLGSLIGSLLSYAIGLYGGRPLIIKYGKYFLLNEHHLEATEKFFTRFGNKTIFISRFIPVVRHLISLPAGTGRMNIWHFLIYTVIGAAIWNAFLAYLGFKLGSNWSEIRKYSEILDIVLVIAIVLSVAYFIWKNWPRKK